MRLCAGVVLACLLLGAGVQGVAAVDSGADSEAAGLTSPLESTADEASGDESAADDDSPAADLLTLDFSVKRLLVSLGFVGALVARRQDRDA